MFDIMNVSHVCMRHDDMRHDTRLLIGCPPVRHREIHPSLILQPPKREGLKFLPKLRKTHLHPSTWVACLDDSNHKTPHVAPLVFMQSVLRPLCTEIYHPLMRADDNFLTICWPRHHHHSSPLGEFHDAVSHPPIRLGLAINLVPRLSA